MSVDRWLTRLSLETYPALIGWPAGTPLPAELGAHLALLRREAPAILFFSNFAGCVLLQLLSFLRFRQSLGQVRSQARDAFLARLANSRIYYLRLVLMLLKSHALLAAYRAPAPALSPALFERRPPWTSHLGR